VSITQTENLQYLYSVLRVLAKLMYLLWDQSHVHP